MNERKNGRRGFTLVEVLLVILILGMLAGVAIVALSGTREGAREDTTALLIKEVESSLDRYNLDINHYPTEAEDGLDALRTKPQFEEEELAEKWNGPYLKKDPVDAWGNKLNYEVVEAGAEVSVPVKVWSSGPNEISGDEDDIRNWEEETE